MIAAQKKMKSLPPSGGWLQYKLIDFFYDEVNVDVWLSFNAQDIIQDICLLHVVKNG